MNFFKPKKRVLLLWLVSIIIWAIALLFSSVPIFPCQTFVYDSTQGFYPDMCPLVIDGHLLVEKSGTYEDTRSTAWTWPVLILVLLIFPYLDPVIIDNRISALQQRFRK